ncbi:hypothetical protein INR49_020720 [Caranx melampygus]|nr:hypothetical protein INR49_020720 [Caranx melampygus]
MSSNRQQIHLNVTPPFVEQLHFSLVKHTWSRHRASPHSETGPHMLQGLPGNQLVGRVAELCQRGEAEFNDPLALLAQPLGVGGHPVHTGRTGGVDPEEPEGGRAGGLLDIPGGHPEPKAVCEEVSMAKMQQRREAIVSELFRSVCAEIRDEEMLQLDRSSTLWSELCPSAKGAVLLYQTVKPDAEPEWSRRPDAQLITSKKLINREEKPPAFRLKPVNSCNL